MEPRAALTDPEEPSRAGTSPVAARILAIDDELAVMDRVRPRTDALVVGSALVSVGVVSLSALSFTLHEPALGLVACFLALPSAVYARHLAKASARRARLERELDELIAAPGARTPAHPSETRPAQPHVRPLERPARRNARQGPRPSDVVLHARIDDRRCPSGQGGRT